ncbi:type II secretion system F family protein [Nocardioides marmoribigeumensis]|uniref:Tight adherence protein B n=1 Tax=Nocardioides marmoribigeumensis TaxID=433649 RepID=A0ABU2C094_9ACTN|nr:type II secretion system F family protein [Nocardioides marmoribigeumensis]MDR7364073.1 tight adherence protein B [Nocardioides marmoribigeumensis]
MGAFVGLLLGVGLLLVWSAFSTPAPERSARPASALREQLDRAGLAGTSPRTVVAASAALFLVAFLTVLVISRTVPVAFVFAAMGAYAPLAWVAARGRSRQQELAEVWPDAVDNLASAVRAGLSLPDALAGLGDRGPEPLREAFQVFARDYQASGRLGDCLDALKVRLADPVGDRVVEGLRVAREVGGGDLGRLLRNLSAHLRDDSRTRSELVARQSWAVNGARLAVAAPWLVLLLMSFQPDVIARYSSPGGVVVLVLGASLCLFAYRAMLRIGRLPTEKRVLS